MSGRMGSPQYSRMAEDYFDLCRQDGGHPSLPGLALALGLDSAEQLIKLASGTDKTSRILRRALSRVEEANVQSLYRKDISASAKFILQSSFGYAEKSSTAQSSQDEIVVSVEGDQGEGR